MELAMETKSLNDLTKEYVEKLSSGKVMGSGTKTFSKLAAKYDRTPDVLWKYLSLKEKIYLWAVEHKKMNDSEAVEKIVVINF